MTDLVCGHAQPPVSGGTRRSALLSAPLSRACQVCGEYGVLPAWVHWWHLDPLPLVCVDWGVDSVTLMALAIFRASFALAPVWVFRRPRLVHGRG